MQANLLDNLQTLSFDNAGVIANEFPSPWRLDSWNIFNKYPKSIDGIIELINPFVLLSPGQTLKDHPELEAIAIIVAKVPPFD